jgi:hypothetical protein
MSIANLCKKYERERSSWLYFGENIGEKGENASSNKCSLNTKSVTLGYHQ